VSSKCTTTAEQQHADPTSCTRSFQVLLTASRACIAAQTCTRVNRPVTYTDEWLCLS
jgi:hypothetical protein